MYSNLRPSPKSASLSHNLISWFCFLLFAPYRLTAPGVRGTRLLQISSQPCVQLFGSVPPATSGQHEGIRHLYRPALRRSGVGCDLEG